MSKITSSNRLVSNFTVHLVAPLHLIGQVPGLLLGTETSYFYIGYSWFFPATAAIVGVYKCRSHPLPSTVFPIHHSLMIPLFDALWAMSELIITRKRIITVALFQQIQSFYAIKMIQKCIYTVLPPCSSTVCHFVALAFMSLSPCLSKYHKKRYIIFRFKFVVLSVDNLY